MPSVVVKNSVYLVEYGDLFENMLGVVYAWYSKVFNVYILSGTL